MSFYNFAPLIFKQAVTCQKAYNEGVCQKRFYDKKEGLLVGEQTHDGENFHWPMHGAVRGLLQDGIPLAKKYAESEKLKKSKALSKRLRDSASATES